MILSRTLVVPKILQNPDIFLVNRCDVAMTEIDRIRAQCHTHQPSLSHGWQFSLGLVKQISKPDSPSVQLSRSNSSEDISSEKAQSLGGAEYIFF